jgi:hypothetical protein
MGRLEVDLKCWACSSSDVVGRLRRPRCGRAARTPSPVEPVGHCSRYRLHPGREQHRRSRRRPACGRRLQGSSSPAAPLHRHGVTVAPPGQRLQGPGSAPLLHGHAAAGQGDGPVASMAATQLAPGVGSRRRTHGVSPTHGLPRVVWGRGRQAARGPGRQKSAVPPGPLTTSRAPGADAGQEDDVELAGCGLGKRHGGGVRLERHPRTTAPRSGGRREWQ